MKLRTAAVVAAVFTVLCCVGTGVLGGGYNLLTSSASAGGCGSTATIDPDQPLPDVGGFTADQRRNAAVIIAVGQQKKVPPRGWVIAIATAMQESRLTNLGNLGADNDHDSLGLFQQRPSSGWGTPAQILDPVYASGKFYDKLVTITNWATIPLTEAAQAVQISAYPDAYAKHEPKATALVNALADGAGSAAGSVADPRCAGPGEIAASGWTRPLATGTVGSGFRTSARPNHQGVDIMVPHDTPIYAASAGVVVRVRCNIEPESYGCDRDGSPATPGCGWYVDIRHADDVYTRYCHQIRRPLVVVGQHVDAGQQIGSSGSSGHSSGPHLHFEVHLGDQSSSTATDPVAFMASVGAALK